jgi:hypothetical protein
MGQGEEEFARHARSEHQVNPLPALPRSNVLRALGWCPADNFNKAILTLAWRGVPPAKSASLFDPIRCFRGPTEPGESRRCDGSVSEENAFHGSRRSTETKSLSRKERA